MEVRGVLSTYHLTHTEEDIFVEFLQHSLNNPAFEFVRYLLGDKFLQFIDVMSGTTLKIPTARSLEHDLDVVKTYVYVERRGFDEISIKEASRIFRKSVLSVKKSVLRAAKVLGTEDILDGDDLNNYLTNIKSVEDMSPNTTLSAESDDFTQPLPNTDDETPVSLDDIDMSVTEAAHTTPIPHTPLITQSPTSTTQSHTHDVNLQNTLNIPESVLTFVHLNEGNKYISVLKEILRQFSQYRFEVFETKTVQYVRIFRTDGSKRAFADLILSNSGFAVDYWFSTEKFRDVVIDTLSGHYKIRPFGSKALTVRRVQTFEDFKKFFLFSVKSFEEAEP